MGHKPTITDSLQFPAESKLPQILFGIGGAGLIASVIGYFTDMEQNYNDWGLHRTLGKTLFHLFHDSTLDDDLSIALYLCPFISNLKRPLKTTLIHLSSVLSFPL